MTSLRLEDLAQYSDSLRARSGERVGLRFVEPRDAEELQHYYGSLSTRSRYNRFLGAMRELPQSLLDRFTDPGRDGGFTVIATVTVDGFESIVGEARYAFHAETNNFEFGISIDDGWQGRGIGAALLENLECRAAAFGATGLFGDTLRSNGPMLDLARKAGFSAHNHPDDWKLVRVEKRIGLEPIAVPCAGWPLHGEVRPPLA